MRILAAVAAFALLPASAVAQPASTVEQRVRKLEGEVRAVQRRVFPNGAPVPADTPPERAPATQQSVTDLLARVDALEAQMRVLTGQVEELQNVDRQLADRMASLEAARAASAPEPQPTPATQPLQPVPGEGDAGTSQVPEEPAVVPAVSTEPLPSDPAEAAYVSGFRLYQARQYDQAIETLQAMAKKYPKHAKASWATNLAGRAHLDAGRPATAAELFFANYQGNPRGERAQDSLFYLGEALVKLDKREQACTVYQELESVYGNKLRAPLKAALPGARKAARCT